MEKRETQKGGTERSVGEMAEEGERKGDRDRQREVGRQAGRQDRPTTAEEEESRTGNPLKRYMQGKE